MLGPTGPQTGWTSCAVSMQLPPGTHAGHETAASPMKPSKPAGVLCGRCRGWSSCCSRIPKWQLGGGGWRAPWHPTTPTSPRSSTSPPAGWLLRGASYEARSITDCLCGNHRGQPVLQCACGVVHMCMVATTCRPRKSSARMAAPLTGQRSSKRQIPAMPVTLFGVASGSTLDGYSFATQINGNGCLDRHGSCVEAALTGSNRPDCAPAEVVRGRATCHNNYNDLRQ